MATFSFWDVVGLIQAQYPQLMPLLQKPGVFEAVANAVQNNWPQARLQAALEATPYFQQTPDTQRQVDVLAATDPATYQQRATQTGDTITRIRNELGLPDPGLPFLASAMFNNWDDTQIRMHLVAQSTLQPQQAGTIGDEMSKLKAIANDYGLPVSDQTVFQYASKIAGGLMTREDFQAYAQNQAKSLYPTLASAIDRGITVRQFADPYLQIAQQELGINPATVDLTDPKWNQMLDSQVGETANMVKGAPSTRGPMTLADWTKTIRSDPTYGYDKTPGAQTQAARFATSLLQEFGNLG